jgi:hypothetical protein
MQEDGSYWKIQSETPFNIHEEFYHLAENDLVSEINFEKYTHNLEVKN